MNKEEARKHYKKLRSLLSEEDRVAKDQLILTNLLKAISFKNFSLLHCFLPIAKLNEINTSFILDNIKILFPELKIALPIVDARNNKMYSVLLKEDTILQTNALGIPEPLVSIEKSIAPKDIDIMLIPLLAADMAGNRVGYGKGFYDQYLSECKADVLKIGLSYFQPLPELKGIAPHDIKINILVTPDQILYFN
ncbi:MAG: 5-formyltetrahydrofolate cyclo-ligase [Cytophagales bacterium]|nr:MAG: 5-formyltetrahydrofolate cyclo-ligase [Cytophagales bacterium]